MHSRKSSFPNSPRGRPGTGSAPSSPRGRPGSSSPTSPRGRPGSSSPTKAKKQGETCGVKVVVRVRPFVTRELEIFEQQVKANETDYLRSIIEMPSDSPGTVSVLDHTKGWGEKERFTFDSAIWSVSEEQQEYDGTVATQEDVFALVGTPVLENAMKGYNNCIFAYGQTGSGKTHTMMGDDDGGDPGVIPKICKGLFEYIEEKKASEESKQFDLEYKVEVRFMEIYNEHVKDLLWHTSSYSEEQLKIENRGQLPNPSNLPVRNHPITGPYVQFLTTKECTTVEDCLSLIEAGNTERAVASTKMNERSSRSHAIFKITFTQTKKSRPKNKFDKPAVNEKVSNINLVDLAGSERVKKSQSSGQQLVEAASINLSLTTLKMVIDALVENSKPNKKKMPVPFRDATLTWLLSDSLGGNSKTIMCCNVSPHPDNAEETVNTLRYGSKAREIVNIVHVNEDLEAKRIQELELEMALLQERLDADPEVAMQTSLRVQDLQEQIDQSLQDLRLARQEAAVNLAKIEEEQDAREKAESELNTAGERLEEQHKTIEQMKQELEEQSKTITSLRGERSREQAENTSLRGTIESLTQRLDEEREKRKADYEKHVAQTNLKCDTFEEDRQTLIMKHGEELRKSEDRYKFFAQGTEQLQNKMSAEIEEQKKELQELSSTNQALTYHVESLRETNDAMAEEHAREKRQMEAHIARLQQELDDEIAKGAELWESRYYEKARELERSLEANNEEWHAKFVQKSEETEDILRTVHEKHTSEMERLKSELELHFEEQRDQWQQRWDEIYEQWQARLETKNKLNLEMHAFLKDVEKREAKYSSLAGRVSAVISDVTLEGSADFMQLLGMLRKFQTEYSSYSPSKETLQRLMRSNAEIEPEPAPIIEEPPTFFLVREGLGKPRRSNSRPGSPHRASPRPASPVRAGSRPPSPSRANPPSPAPVPVRTSPARSSSRPQSPTRSSSRPPSPYRGDTSSPQLGRMSSLVRGHSVSSTSRPVIARSRRY
eukprot:TRINITY_DN1738_c0_g1_i1.p1 TRINITY_DN1738_c0_g1~~TRINITY_DN1738_c0_g1_i1.p1  ORF type:complete len:1014 (+),score=284.16 TRINITY_DN1738_c0_g1_i1:33-3044(+)